MKKEMSLQIPVKERVQYCLADCIERLAKALSFCLEETVTPSQFLRILHAVVAFTFLVFSYGCALFSVICLGWFVMTLLDCKRVGVS